MPDSPTRVDLTPQQAEERQRVILLRLIRAAFFVLLTTVTVLNILQVGTANAPNVISLQIGWGIKVAIAAVLAVVVLAVDAFTPRKKISTLSAVLVGVLAGLVATAALSFIVDLLVQTYEIQDPTYPGLIKVLIGICLCYLGVSIVLQTKDDFRLVIPYVEFAKQFRGAKPLLLDSSAIIDARVVDLVQTGVIQSSVVIPRFVVDELQTLADSQDKLRRNKGRRGLDVIAKLQRTTLDITIDEAQVPGKAVDQMLVELAKTMPGTIVTTDLGLKRVAAIQGVSVLNLNEVANALKPSVIPGETLRVLLLRPGEQSGQAVGYLDDGTMVVAEDGSGYVGQNVLLAVTSSLQTSAGRLIFGRVVGAEPGPEPAAAPEPAQTTDGHASAQQQPPTVARLAETATSQPPARGVTPPAPPSSTPPREPPAQPGQGPRTFRPRNPRR